jgi:ABC-type nitrate/sulfonate/bicarbonate transport system substrate-binding protein
MKKLFYLALVTFYSFLALSAADSASKKIKVGVSPVITSSGLFLAHEKGYFKDEGLRYRARANEELRCSDDTLAF